jgi:RecA-family ATPase
VTILSHPSLAGITSGSGISGSTAWHGAFRFRQYLKGVKAADGEQPDNDLRELEFKKNQYGPTAETIVLRYQRGLFLPLPGVTSLDKATQDAKADDIFLDLVRRFTNLRWHVGSTSAFAMGNNSRSGSLGVAWSHTDPNILAWAGSAVARRLG